MKKIYLTLVLILSVFVCNAQSEDPTCREAFEKAKKVYLEKGKEEGIKSFVVVFDCGDDKISAEATKWILEKAQETSVKDSIVQKEEQKFAETNSVTVKKGERSEVVVLHGYLKLYPEDLGEFSYTPHTLIKQINKEESYGYDSWRLPTQEELELIRSNGYLSGLDYMTQLNPRGVLLLVTTKKPVVHKPKLPIAKQDISIHGGIGLDIADDAEFGVTSLVMKYKYKPSDKYDIRLLGEIGTSFVFADQGESLSILPIMAGINYEYRFTENTSIWGDLGLGLSIPLHGGKYTDWDDYFSSYNLGFVVSPEIGIKIIDFSFSFKVIYAYNSYSNQYLVHDIGWDGSDFSYYNYYDSHNNSAYVLFQLGYHF